MCLCGLVAFPLYSPSYVLPICRVTPPSSRCFFCLKKYCLAIDYLAVLLNQLQWYIFEHYTERLFHSNWHSVPPHTWYIHAHIHTKLSDILSWLSLTWMYVILKTVACKLTLVFSPKHLNRHSKYRSSRDHEGKDSRRMESSSLRLPALWCMVEVFSVQLVPWSSFSLPACSQ